jgi:anti-sigma regulatory factor (Ser/Thr protein kinase)
MNNKTKTALAEPEASSMMENFTAIGYSIETAISDIIDNSISAEAKNIWINYSWKGEKTIISIRDDGFGMNNDELIQAMRPGSKHPKEERSPKDLGRFGLGLKTASLSQTRKFSVISKKEGFKTTCWAWDLDHVNQTKRWELISKIPSIEDYNLINDSSSGTVVIWYCLDSTLKGVSEEDNDTLNKFMEIMDLVKRHQSMVFHRFIEKGKIRIWFQDREIKPWDPYLRGKNGVQSDPEEYLDQKDILIKGYILPHKSKLDEITFKDAAGIKGWNQHQGFYIYRKERMLVAGDWLGLYKKEEHYKLCRILIDLPNSIDSSWKIDIKKSTATPPLKIKNQLKAYSDEIRKKAVSVYRHRGKIIERKHTTLKFIPVWKEKIRRGKRFYSINKEHPLIEDFINNPSKEKIKDIFRFLEETVPIPLITIRESEEPESHGTPFESLNHEILLNKIKEIMETLLSQGKSQIEIKSIILSIEPFDKYPEYIESILENI